MKKIFLIMCLTAGFTLTYGQEKPCPTKLETMDWIAGKMKQYLQETVEHDEPMKFESYSNGVFKCRQRRTLGNGSYGGYRIITIDLNKLTKYTVFDGLLYWIEGNKIISTDNYDDRNKYEDTEYGNVVSTTEEALNKIRFFNFNLEDGLTARVLKALNCLKQYNIAPATGEKF